MSSDPVDACRNVKALKRRVEVSFPDLSADELEVFFPQKVRLAGLWRKPMYFVVACSDCHMLGACKA